MKKVKKTDKIRNLSEMEIESVMLELLNRFPKHACYPKDMAEDIVCQILLNHRAMDKCTPDSDKLERLSGLGIRGLVTNLRTKKGKLKPIFVVLEIEPHLLKL